MIFKNVFYSNNTEFQDLKGSESFPVNLPDIKITTILDSNSELPSIDKKSAVPYFFAIGGKWEMYILRNFPNLCGDLRSKLKIFYL